MAIFHLLPSSLPSHNRGKQKRRPGVWLRLHSMARLTNIARFTPRSQKSEMVSSVCLTSLIQYNSSGSRILLRTYTRFSFVKSIAALIPNSPSLAESASFVIGLRLRSTSPVPGAATTIASFTGHITPTTLLRRQIIIFALPLSLAPSISRNSDPGSVSYTHLTLPTKA